MIRSVFCGITNFLARIVNYNNQSTQNNVGHRIKKILHNRTIYKTNAIKEYRNSAKINKHHGNKSVPEIRKLIAKKTHAKKTTIETFQKKINDWVKSEGGRAKEAADRIINAYKNQSQQLDLSGLALQSLPEEIGGLKALQTLRLADNQLTSLPESIGDLKALTRLTLSNNQFTSLPGAINGLTHLQALSLIGNHLASLPESIGDLTTLQILALSHNRLASLPESISGCTHLRTLILSANPLISLPNNLVLLPSNCDIELMGTSLSQNIMNNLSNTVNAVGYNGPRIHYSMAHEEPITQERSITESLQDLFKNADKIYDEEFERTLLTEEITQPEEASLRSWLSRLTYMQDYKASAQHKKILSQKILNYLELAQQNQGFREAFFRIIDGAAATCGDRMALSVLHLGLAAKQSNITNLKELADFIIHGPWAIEQLEGCAREKVQTLHYVDEIEVYLGYPVRLKDRLNLMIDVESMLYFNCSQLTTGDLDIAYEFISSQIDTEEKRHKILIQRDDWKDMLAKTYPEQFNEIQQKRQNNYTENLDAMQIGALNDNYEKALLDLTKQALTTQMQESQECQISYEKNIS